MMAKTLFTKLIILIAWNHFASAGTFDKLNLIFLVNIQSVPT